MNRMNKEANFYLQSKLRPGEKQLDCWYRGFRYSDMKHLSFHV